jgi:hypothetical protein
MAAVAEPRAASSTRKLSPKAWREMAAELADVVTEDDTLDGYLSALELTGDTNRVALFDRNSLDGKWRPVVLELQERGDSLENSMWKLPSVLRLRALARGRCSLYA